MYIVRPNNTNQQKLLTKKKWFQSFYWFVFKVCARPEADDLNRLDQCPSTRRVAPVTIAPFSIKRKPTEIGAK